MITLIILLTLSHNMSVVHFTETHEIKCAIQSEVYRLKPSADTNEGINLLWSAFSKSDIGVDDCGGSDVIAPIIENWDVENCV